MKKEIIKVKVDVTKLPNKMHFEIQKNTHSNVFKDKTKYNRKNKHQKVDGEENWWK